MTAPTPSSWDPRVRVPRGAKAGCGHEGPHPPPRALKHLVLGDAPTTPGGRPQVPGLRRPPPLEWRKRWRSGLFPLGARSWGTGRLGRSPPPPGTREAQDQPPPTRPDAWKLPEGRFDLTATPGQAYPPTPELPGTPSQPAPRPKLTQRRAPKSRSSWCRGPARYPGGAKRQRGHTCPRSARKPPGRLAARTRRRVRREGRPDALPHALSRPGIYPSLARGAMKPRPLAPGALRRRSSGSCARGRQRGHCAAQARHAADGPPPRGCRGGR